MPERHSRQPGVTKKIKNEKKLRDIKMNLIKPALNTI